MILATGMSQIGFLESLIVQNIDWSWITVFYLDSISACLYRIRPVFANTSRRDSGSVLADCENFNISMAKILIRSRNAAA